MASTSFPAETEPSTANSGENILEMTISSQQNIEINTDWITASTFFPNGDLVLCDGHNKKLYLYSPTFNLKESVDLPSGLWDICTVTDTEVAVTLPEQQKIQFFSVQPRLGLGQSLKVHRKCWGIDCHGGMIYVTCHDDPSNGEILLMMMNGEVQRRLGLDDKGRYMFPSPDYVSVSRTSGRVYISDYSTNNVTCLTQHGEVVYQYTHRKLSHPTNIHVDNQDNLLVSGSLSRNIHRVDKHGTHHSLMHVKNDSDIHPWCLSYRNSDGALVVGMNKLALESYSKKLLRTLLPKYFGQVKPACSVYWLKT